MTPIVGVGEMACDFRKVSGSLVIATIVRIWSENDSIADVYLQLKRDDLDAFALRGGRRPGGAVDEAIGHGEGGSGGAIL